MRSSELRCCKRGNVTLSVFFKESVYIGHICEQSDTYEVTAAVKKEIDNKNIQGYGKYSVNIVSKPKKLGSDVGPTGDRSWSNVVSITGGAYQTRWSADSSGQSTKSSRIRAQWERIEGVGLRCTWVEGPDTDRDGIDLSA